MRTVTAQVLVQMGEYCHLTPADFETMDGNELADRLAFYTNPLTGDYAVVGEATITMKLHTKEKLIAAKVESLNAVLQKEIADSEVRKNILREQINSLLAITYKPEES